MKTKIWKLLVITVLLITFIAFFFVFQEDKIQPTLGEIPFVFWSGFLLTVLLVGLTYLGSMVFPYDESTGK